MSSNNTTNSNTTSSNSSSNTVSSSSNSGTNSIEAEFNRLNSKEEWGSIFTEIRRKCEQEAEQKDFTTAESKKSENKHLNRYRDVAPYDHSRIVLKRGTTDYINANLIKMDNADRKYILCQGPLPITVSHFWVMVWEHNSCGILMLNRLIEKRQIKCHLYWPEKIGEEHKLELPDVQLSIEYLDVVEYTNFSKRTFRLTDLESGKTRKILQFHYTTWPDFGTPSSPFAFLQFLKAVRDSGALDKDVGPPIIHCSAGIGRSGTFCLVDSCLVLIDKEGENNVSVQNVLLELRQYRMGLIQTADQLIFSYRAIIEGMRRIHNTSFEEFEELSRAENKDHAASDQETENDDAPPPLPPPRSHSLTITQKPLPLIPNSESVHEDFLICNDRDIVNNQVNLEKSKQYEVCKDRPLPPLPKEGSLEKVHEADSSEGDSGASGESGEEDELIEENDSDQNGDSTREVEDNSDNIKSSVLDDTTITSSSSSTLSTATTSATASASSSKTSTLESNRGDEKSFDADATLPPLPSEECADNERAASPEGGLSPNAELRRRKRLERQTAMEEKIRDIKRKQKEAESTAAASPKKRRKQQDTEK
ncbi:tyrosine-protein phosphatase non-receptor type 61F isoform X2 [Toxorhynchites rutilus septentrionalis]|uniref:tyrosine-protein phosphatase non-receptor type 61F isoform X2 n=1 Tax=Toxorhynchites rutilus septentrionalis TaxID=329112 RepID=UPI0024790D33|nr:tyrosine-protein phosphatase non-receptor type 61F isoform X2 [Toxorhynchites rutilus septentrionalis]